jgi:SAM-dependent methyltransferase
MFGHHDHAPGSKDASTRRGVIHWARFYDPVVTLLTLGRAPAMREEAADLAAIQPGESVLEVGCGSGELTQRARACAGSTGLVCGIDPSPEMIGVAREKADRAKLRVDYRVAAIEALPFGDETFDVVLSSLMVHHVPVDLKALGLAEERLALPIVLHGGMAHGVQDLPPVVEAAGFVDVETGKMRFRPLGFVSARLAA